MSFLIEEKRSSRATSDHDLDLSEILHLMQDKPAGSMVRCSKARAMFASRACRKSVMVGHPLTRAQMTSVRMSTHTLSTRTSFLTSVGGATYGDDGPALELSSRKADDATYATDGSVRPSCRKEDRLGKDCVRMACCIHVL